MVADELRRQADHFIELTDLQKSIGRSGDRPSQRPARDDGDNYQSHSEQPSPVIDEDEEGAPKAPGDFAELI